jgi:succinylglutamate desuccinylase
MLDGNGDQYSNASRLLALLENNKATVIGREFFNQAMNFFNTEFQLFTSLGLGEEVNNKKLINQFHNKGT